MSDDYSRAIARTAVAQLAELATYEAVQDSAADVLSELLIKYITELSSTAHGYAELANRTGVNVHDLLLSLDDLGTSVPELQSYLKELHPDANTFPHALPDYPVRRPARSMPTWLDKGEEPPPHIPSFLPAFPDKHTYMRTPTFPGHETQPDKQAQAQHKARKQAETALLNLHHATMAAAKQAAKQAANATATGQADASSAPTGNPFLAQPEVVVLPPGQAGTAGGLIPGTGAYEPHMASKAFASVLVGAEGDVGADVGGDGMGDALEVKDEPMTDLNWKFQARMDAQGTLKQPLGTSTDYASTAFTAAHTYALGTADPDAYEEAAKGEAPVAGATGTVRKRKSTYGTVVDPLKRKAQDVMEKAKDPNPAAEGDE